MRLELLVQFGEKKTNALLRLATRHGRLHPGLAPQLDGPVVNSEGGEFTPPDELARMMASGDPSKSKSPFLAGSNFL
eukprot:7337819-Prymnesium_polylepis.1